MANQTANYNLTQPLPEEFYDVGVQNENMGKIDAALAGLDAAKVDREPGKGLSSNDYTEADKQKLDGVEAGAQVNTVLGVKGSANSNYSTGNVSLSATDVGAALSWHEHAMSDVSYGILPVTQGGTGCETAAKAFSKLVWRGVAGANGVDWDDIKEPGVYSANVQGIGCSEPALYIPAVLEVLDSGFETYIQRLSTTNKSGCVAMRAYYNESWTPWAWITPPGRLGTEFQTAELWQGKPVYTKIINCGTASNGKEVEYGLTGQTLVRASGVIGPFVCPRIHSTLDNANSCWMEFWNQKLYIYCGSNVTGSYTAYAQLWYTKS